MIYTRYLQRRMLELLFGFCGAFLFLCFFIEMVSNRKLHQVPLMEMMQMQLVTLLCLLPPLLPTFVLFSTVLLFISLRQRNEMMALLAGGVSRRALLTPLLRVGMGVALLLCAHLQWIAPRVYRMRDHIYTEQVATRSPIRSLTLESDGSPLIYRDYDPILSELHDLFWIRTAHEIWHIKTLNLRTAEGRWVDQLKQEEGRWNIVASAPLFDFHAWQLNAERLRAQLLPPHALPISQVWQRANHSWHAMPDSAARLTTYLYGSLFLPLFAFLAVLLPG